MLELYQHPAFLFALYGFLAGAIPVALISSIRGFIARLKARRAQKAVNETIKRITSEKSDLVTEVEKLRSSEARLLRDLGELEGLAKGEAERERELDCLVKATRENIQADLQAQEKAIQTHLQAHLQTQEKAIQAHLQKQEKAIQADLRAQEKAILAHFQAQEKTILEAIAAIPATQTAVPAAPKPEQSTPAKDLNVFRLKTPIPEPAGSKATEDFDSDKSEFGAEHANTALKILPKKRKEGDARSGEFVFKPAPTAKELEQAISLETDWESQIQSRSSYARSLSKLMALFLVCALGLLLYFVISGLEENKSAAATPIATFLEREEDVRKADQKMNTFYKKSSNDELKAAAENAVKGFMTAKSPEEATKFLAGGDLRLPRMKEFYGRTENSWPRGFKKVSKVAFNAVASIPYLLIFAEDQESRIHQFVGISGDDSVLLDWECSVEYSELSIERFFETKPASPVKFRLIVKAVTQEDPAGWGDYFPGGKSLRFTGPMPPSLKAETPPQKKFFQLSDLNSTKGFYAIFDEDNLTLRYLHEVLSANSTQHPLQILICWDNDLKSAKIVSLQNDWWFDYEALNVRPPLNSLPAAIRPAQRRPLSPFRQKRISSNPEPGDGSFQFESSGKFDPEVGGDPADFSR